MNDAETHDAMSEQGRVIVGLGEILWDVFPDGPRFGGAPANFACTAAALLQDPDQVQMVSAVGQDDLGARALAELAQKQVAAQAVAQLAQPTGQVLVTLNDAGQATYEFAADPAWDELTWNRELEELAARAAACCFGSLAQRSGLSRSTIQQFVGAMRSETPKVFDVNIRQPYCSPEVLLASLQLASVLKLNDDELPVLATLCGLDGTTLEMLRQLTALFDLRCVALTRGADGALLVTPDGEVEHPGVPCDVVDTVGAGDAFTASLVVGLLASRPWEEILEHACQLAAYVCSQPGATPAIPARFR